MFLQVIVVGGKHWPNPDGQTRDSTRICLGHPEEVCETARRNTARATQCVLSHKLWQRSQRSGTQVRQDIKYDDSSKTLKC